MLSVDAIIPIASLPLTCRVLDTRNTLRIRYVLQHLLVVLVVFFNCTINTSTYIPEVKCQKYYDFCGCPHFFFQVVQNARAAKLRSGLAFYVAWTTSSK